MLFVSHFKSAIGLLEITGTAENIISISFDPKLKPTCSNDILTRCINELTKYFNGELKSFETPYDLAGTNFQKKVWTELAKIPYGKTITYTDLAIRLGDIKSIRAAGTANGKNPLPIIVPCHRVIGKNGDLVGFSGGLENKKWLLKHEGVIRGEQVEIFA